MAQLLPPTLRDPEDIGLGLDQSITYGESWQWVFPPCSCGKDYPHLEVVGNRAVKTFGSDTLEQWIRFALTVDRYAHPIYSTDFGVEFRELIGRSATLEEAETEVTRMIREALEIDPRVQLVRTIEVSEASFDSIEVQIEVVTFTADIQRLSVIANLEA